MKSDGNKRRKPEKERIEVDSVRYCFKCHDETPFVFTYAEGYLIKAQCKKCGTIERDKKTLAKVFIEDLIDRGFEALKRETKAVLHTPSEEMPQIPKKAFEKSAKIIRQILNLFGE